MDKPSENKNIDVQQIPHSGNLPVEMQEKPFREFDNTSLKDAYALTDEAGEYIIKTPDTAAELKTKSRKGLFIGLGATAAGLALATGAWLGINTMNEAPKSQPVATAPSELTPTNSPEVPKLDVTKIPESVVEYNLFNSLSEAEKAEIVRMEKMSVAEFRQLPSDEQSAFANFIYDNNIDVLKYRLDNNNQSALYKGISQDTAAGMQKNSDVKFLLLASLKTMSKVNGITFDKDTALKASFLVNPEANEVTRHNIDEQINSWNLNTSSTALRNIALIDSVTLDNGDVVSNEMNTDSKEISQTTYKVADFRLINGELKKDSYVSLSVSENDPRFIDIKR